MDVGTYIESLPFDKITKHRIKITVGCSDLDAIPRVSRAGQVFNGPNGRYQVMHNGIKVVEDGYIGRWVTEIIALLKGCHEPQEEKAFAEILQYIPEKGTMLELGSWWSYYSLWFQKEIKAATNYMIEPDINNLEIGKRNFALNRMLGNHFNAAIGRNSIESIVYRCYESDNVERSIPVFSVDDFIESHSIKSIDLLLADIQGAELEMLQGAVGSISNGIIRFVVLSTHHYKISGDPLMHQKCIRFLEEHGAYILVEHGITESYSGDGLIVASFKRDDFDLPKIEVSINRAKNSLFGELEYDLSQSLAEQNQISGELSNIVVERDGLVRDIGGVRSDLDGVRLNLQETLSELNNTRAELQETRTELHASRVELQETRSDLRAIRTDLKKIRADRDVVYGELNALRLARSQLTDELSQTIAGKNALSTELAALTKTLVITQSENELNRTRLGEVVADRDLLQKKHDDLWQERHRYWSELDDVYHSRSWRITAPMRRITPWVWFWRDRIIRLYQRPSSYLAAKLIDRFIKYLRSLPLGNRFLARARDLFPNFYLRWALWTNRTANIETSPPPSSINFSPTDEITSIYQKHFLALFQRELRQRQKNAEVQQ